MLKFYIFILTFSMAPDMETSERGKEFIAQHENIRLKAYRDPVGIWTIGIGHTAAAGPPKPVPGMVITRKEVLEILEKDLSRFESAINDLFKHIELKQHEFDAISSFTFNVGAGALQRSSFYSYMKRGEKTVAANSLLAWVKAGKRTLPGLIKRRRAERLLFLGQMK